jgi:hypothetical protein
MNDPERLSKGHPSGLSARLLRAGAAEAPSGRSLERTLAALGAATATLGSAGAAGALGAASSGKVASLTLLGLAKWAGVGLAGGALVSVVAHVAPPAPSPQSASPAPRVELVAPPSPDRVAEPKSVLAAPVAEPSASIEPPRSVPVTQSPGARPSEPAGAPLAAEVAFVDRGRAAFQRGEAGAALAALATYERTYPERRLLPEVLYLRMEALAASGDDVRAHALARRIVREFSKSPHRARAAALLGAP